MLEGKNVNLKVVEKDDIYFLFDCVNDVRFFGEYHPVEEQISKSELMKGFDNPPNLVVLIEYKDFIIQKKDGTRIGVINHVFNQPYRLKEISHYLVPSERGKGYGTEAVQLMVDHLFLSENIFRIQAITNVGNKASQRVLEKAGFKVEGTIRKLRFVRGVMADYYLYSILREEWKEPKILTKNRLKLLWGLR